MDTSERVRRACQISDTEKIIHLSDAELEALNFLGPSQFVLSNVYPSLVVTLLDAVQQVIDFIGAIKKIPQQFEWLSVFQLQCLNAHLQFHPPALPTWPTPSSQAMFLSSTSGTTATEPDLVSVFERVHFYNGVSEDHPLLLHRSDLLQHPFVIPERTPHTANHPILKNQLWKETVAPEIMALLKDPICRDANTTATAIFNNEYIVLWISVHPNTTKETSCCDANSDILAILAKHGIQDAAVHWIEGAVESLGAGPPPMMRIVEDMDPTHYIRRALTAVLGIPLAAEDVARGDAQGTLGLYFHEGKDQRGNKSKKVMCITTTKHVTSSDTTQDYEYSRHSGDRKQLDHANLLAKQLMKLEAKPKSENEEEAAADNRIKEWKEQDLTRAKIDIVMLGDFLQLLTSTWSDSDQRVIGYLDWAPKIVNNLDDHCYTRDLAVVTLDENKFKDRFQGNSVYLAGKYTGREIKSFFYPNVANPSCFEYPDDHLFRLTGYVDAAGLANPYLLDENNEPGFIVAKDGQSTALTFGRFSELEAYTCDKFEQDSWEVAVLNFSKKHGDFSAKGDSGAAIFNAEGKLVAILHSGMSSRGMSNHVTFGTPGHYVVKLIKERYPHADFDRLKFDA